MAVQTLVTNKVIKSEHFVTLTEDIYKDKTLMKKGLNRGLPGTVYPKVDSTPELINPNLLIKPTDMLIGTTFKEFYHYRDRNDLADDAFIVNKATLFRGSYTSSAYEVTFEAAETYSDKDYSYGWVFPLSETADPSGGWLTFSFNPLSFSVDPNLVIYSIRTANYSESTGVKMTPNQTILAPLTVDRLVDGRFTITIQISEPFNAIVLDWCVLIKPFNGEYHSVKTLGVGMPKAELSKTMTPFSDSSYPTPISDIKVTPKGLLFRDVNFHGDQVVPSVLMVKGVVSEAKLPFPVDAETKAKLPNIRFL